MSATFDSVLRSEAMSNKAVNFGTQLQKQDLDDERKRRSMIVATVLTVVVGVVTYFVSGIYGMSKRYPHLFRWYDAMRSEKVQGQGRHDFSMYQVCTASDFGAAASMLNLLLVWKALHPAAAQFLMYTVEYYEQKAKADPKQRLTALHWAGGRAQTNYQKLLGPKGWASTGCSTGTLEQKKATLIQNWNSGAAENLWYDLLPKPVDETGKLGFLSVPMIQELYSDSGTTGGAITACDEEGFATSKLGRLFDGGLCNAAFKATSDDASAADLFNEYFAVHDNPTASQDCAGAAQAGAVQGAMSGGMAGMMALQMMPFGLGRVAKGASLLARAVKFVGPAAIKLGGAATIAGGAAVAGGITSANAAKASCKRSGGAV